MHLRRRRRRGAQAVEFALVAPLLVTLFGALVDYGWYYHRRLETLAATRDGGRVGSTHDADRSGSPCTLAESAIVAALRQTGIASADASHVSGSVTIDPTTGDRVLSVATELAHQRLFGLVPSPERLRAQVFVRLEDQRNPACSF